MTAIRHTISTIKAGHVTRTEGVWLLVALGYSLGRARWIVAGL